MQKLIAKYGVAAHLALLAVAPLFLFPFFGQAETARVLLWLSLPAFLWSVLEPSIRNGEMLHHARRRVFKAIVSDPLFWASLFIVLLTGVRALNDGIALVYDAEVAKWNLSKPLLPIFPGCVTGTGFLPFAAWVAGTVMMQGCRHSLGRSARMAFLLLASALAGLAAVIAVWSGASGNPAVRSAIGCSPTASDYVGVAFHLHLLGAMAALFSAFESKWNLTMPLFALALGGTAAGAFLFSPVIVTVVFAAAEILLLIYVFICSMRALAASGEFKLLVVFGIAFALGGLLVMALEPGAVEERLAAFRSLEFLPDSFADVRRSLSVVALRSWLTSLWLGTGVESFPLAFRFHAASEDWQLIRAGAQTVPNGWWFLLAERGIVGAVIVGLPVGFLAFSYVRRLVGWIGSYVYPHPGCLLGPLVLAAVSVTGLYGCAFFRSDVIIIAVALLSVSANSFPREKRRGDG